MSKVITIIALLVLGYLFPIVGMLVAVGYGLFIWFSLKSYEIAEGVTVDIASPKNLASEMAGGARIGLAHTSNLVGKGLIYAAYSNKYASKTMDAHNVQLQNGWKQAEARVKEIDAKAKEEQDALKASLDADLAALEELLKED